MKVRSPQYEASQEDNKEIGRKVKVSEIIASHWEIRSTLQRADSVSLGLFLSLKVRERKGLRSGQWGGGDYRRGTHLNHLSEFWCNNVSLLVLSKALSHQDKAGRRTTYSGGWSHHLLGARPALHLHMCYVTLCVTIIFSFGPLGWLFQKCFVSLVRALYSFYYFYIQLKSMA